MQYLNFIHTETKWKYIIFSFIDKLLDTLYEIVCAVFGSVIEAGPVPTTVPAGSTADLCSSQKQWPEMRCTHAHVLIPTYMCWYVRVWGFRSLVLVLFTPAFLSSTPLAFTTFPSPRIHFRLWGKRGEAILGRQFFAVISCHLHLAIYLRFSPPELCARSFQICFVLGKLYIFIFSRLFNKQITLEASRDTIVVILCHTHSWEDC